MAARKATLVVNCLKYSRQSSNPHGVIFRSLSISKAKTSRPSLRSQSCPMVARNMCSSLASLNISDKDEELEIPRAADSHLTPSIFDNELVNKFVNCMMWDGKKSLSQKILKMALEDIKTEQLQKQRESTNPDSIQTDPLQIFLEAVENCKPIVGVRGMNRGGKVYQVPIPLPPQRRRFLAIKWLITAAREQQKTNKNARMYKKLAKELLNAYNNEGTVIKKKRELHRRAEDNRAYAHYRWW
ncbi:small ribosomal subunit protein uS7-like isoform X2 [Porites lutea]|uniref:small ribosomal subunit protein uS7-like isoform X2 n=1 Tax=Porites lutea TaxID=51062 RepID=UPI003CC5C671